MFGHCVEKCDRITTLPPAIKVPLPRLKIKWVPKVILPPTAIPAISVSPTVETESESLADSDNEVIYWKPNECSWVHRYDLQRHSYHMF